MPTAARQLQQKVNAINGRLALYKRDWGRRAGIMALEWIDGNFRAQGYRDNVLIPWKATKSGKYVRFGMKSEILQGKTRRLRRGNKMRPEGDKSTIYNSEPYARVHNDGYNGNQQVRAHNRRKRLNGTITDGLGNSYNYGARSSIRTQKRIKDAKLTETIKVRAFVRRMKIPRRQFMPSEQRGSKMLTMEIRTMTRQDMDKILHSKKL